MAARSPLAALAPGVVLALFVVMFAPGQPEQHETLPQVPRSVRLPSGAVLQVHPVGTGRAGALAVPEDARAAGWWRGGARLGDTSGSTLLAAHVDSRRRGLGPFAELYTTRRGARVVLRSDDLRQVFRIRSVRVVPRGSVASRPGLFAPSGVRRLVLVTCAPPYDERRGYLNLVVVTAAPSGPATRGP